MYEVEGVSPGQPLPREFNIAAAQILGDAGEISKKLQDEKEILKERLNEKVVGMMHNASILAMHPQFGDIEKHVSAFGDAAKQLNGMSKTDPEYFQAYDNFSQAYDQVWRDVHLIT